AMPPITAPLPPPMPLWLPSTTTGRTLSTTPSATWDRRCASPGLITSGLVVEHAANTHSDTTDTALAATDIICFMRTPRLAERGQQRPATLRHGTTVAESDGTRAPAPHSSMPNSWILRVMVLRPM